MQVGAQECSSGLSRRKVKAGKVIVELGNRGQDAHHLGLGRVGATATHGSGDLLIAFSNAPENRVDRFETRTPFTNTFVNDTQINDLFQATLQATAEADLTPLRTAAP